MTFKATLLTLPVALPHGEPPLKAGVGGEAAIRALATELDPEQAALLDLKLTVCLRRT